MILFDKEHSREFENKANFSPTQTIVFAFLGIIIVGTCLLLLPVSSGDGKSVNLMTALFTATSAVCITGLSLCDTWTQWSSFGQFVILALIEIGGLGFMSAMVLFLYLFHRRIGLKQRMLMAQAMGVSDTGGILRLQNWMLKSSLLAQGIGTFLLFLYFCREYPPLYAFKLGIFHAVSAYCNAGFDIFGFIEPGASLIHFAEEPFVLLVLSFLIIYGGLGFLVLEQWTRIRNFRKLNVYAKIVIVMTVFLLLFGTIAFCITEWNNPETIGDFSFWNKISGAFFQSVTSRTAGFAAMDQGKMSEAGKALTTLLMMVGGASGSTAGGIKVGTLAVILLFLRARSQGQNEASIANRTINNEQVLDAMTIAFIMTVLALFGCVFISITSHVNLATGLFEAVSALSNTGLSTGGTANLSPSTHILLIIYMFFGRVGVFSISLSFLIRNRAEGRIHYADTKMMIG